VELHRLLRDHGFQRIIGVGKRGQFESHGNCSF
jgi:hypothetical protein